MRAFAHLAVVALACQLSSCGSPSKPPTEPPPGGGGGGGGSGSGAYAVGFSTYLGGTADDANQGVFTDSAGNAYIVGGYNGATFPATLNTCGLDDSIVAKFSPTGALVWSRCIGGSAAKDYVHTALIDAQGNVFVSGVTFSSNFPTTAGAFQPALRGPNDDFVMKLSESGAVVWSTLLGGSGEEVDRSSLALDAAGNVYVSGGTRSPDFPTTRGAYQTAKKGLDDGYVSKLSADGRTLLASTLFGGSAADRLISGIHVHSDGTVYVGGFTSSPDIPVTANAFQRTYAGGETAFLPGDGLIVRFTSTLSSVVFATYLGGSGYDSICENHGYRVDSTGRSIISGETESTNLPVSATAFQKTLRGPSDSYVAILSADGSTLQALTYVGGNGRDTQSGVYFDTAGNISIVGETASADYPTLGALKTTLQGSTDGTLSILKPDLSGLIFSTLYGGTGTDRFRGIAVSGTRVVVSGDTTSSDYPVTAGASQAVNKGQRDFVLTSFTPAAGSVSGETFTAAPTTMTLRRAGAPGNVAEPLETFTSQDGVRVGVQVLATRLAVPSSLAFAPDGRLFVAERPGRVRIVQNGRLLPQPALTLTDVLTTGDGGVLGIALHPSFASNHLLYLSYTAAGPNGSVGRLMRFREVANTLAEPAVLLDDVEATNVNSGSRIRFGPDGRLYLAVGDAAEHSMAQDLASLNGKILRLADDGTTPGSNPFRSPVWSWGHRNPQGLDWHPVTGDLFEIERGPAGSDEINTIERGRNYGWPSVEGSDAGSTAEPPLMSLSPAIGPAGASFYSGSAFPAFRNDLFVAALEGQAVLRVRLDAANPRRVLSMERLLEHRFGRLGDIISGADGFLYVATNNRDGRTTAAADDDRILRLIPLDR